MLGRVRPLFRRNRSPRVTTKPAAEFLLANPQHTRTDNDEAISFVDTVRVISFDGIKAGLQVYLVSNH